MFLPNVRNVVEHYNDGHVQHVVVASLMRFLRLCVEGKVGGPKKKEVTLKRK